MNGYFASRSSTASHAVITAVAAREGVDPVDLHTPLYSAIDSDGLDRLVESATASEDQAALQVQFRYYGYEVTVTQDGQVTLRE
jgi:hypothetical protein